jgi:ABC-type nitrate/sulfonate/bicarbonate transport system permease component
MFVHTSSGFFSGAALAVGIGLRVASITIKEAIMKTVVCALLLIPITIACPAVQSNKVYPPI